MNRHFSLKFTFKICIESQCKIKVKNVCSQCNNLCGNCSCCGAQNQLIVTKFIFSPSVSTWCSHTRLICWNPNIVSCFSDSTPLVVFLSTFQGIRLLEVDGSRTTYSSLIQTATSASRIDLLYSTDLIVFQHFSDGKLHKYVHTITCVIMSY